MKTILLTVINLVSLPASLLFAFMVFMGGAFASDSGTTAALITSFALMALALAYPVLTVVAIVFSRKRRSLWIASLPLVLPIVLAGWLLSPAFSFS